MGRGITRVAPEGKKWCPDCEDFIDRKNFTTDNHSKDLLYSYCKTHLAARRKTAYQRDPQKHIDRQDRYNYGLSDSSIRQKLYEQQDGLCAVCKRPEKQVAYDKSRRLALDHCHTTGKVRGLLCSDCNIAL